MKRPLALFGAAYFAASFIGIWMPQQVLGPAAAFLLCAGIICLLRHRHVTGKALAGIAAACALSGLWIVHVTVLTPAYACIGRETAVNGIVTSVDRRYDAENATVRISSLNGKRVYFPLAILVEELPDAQEGNLVSLVLVPESVPENSYRLSRFADGIFLEAEEASACTVTGRSTSPVFLFRAIRNHLAEGLRWLIQRDTGEIAAAMTLGDRSGLSETVLSPFRKSGMSHILVVSGLHLSMVSGAVYQLLRRKFSRRISAVFASAATILFMLLVGFTPSVMRAGSAMLLLYLGRLFRRRSDGFTSLGFSAFALCLFNPYAAVDAGLLLSYSATAAVMLVGQHERQQLWNDRRAGREIAEHILRVRKLLHRAAIPVLTALFTLPVITVLGSGISVWSVPANLIAVPLAGPAVVTGLLAALCNALCPMSLPADICSFLCGFCITIIYKTAQIAAWLPGGYFRFSGLPQLLPLVFPILLFVMGRRWNFPKRVNLFASAALCLLLFGFQFYINQNVARAAVVGTSTSPALVVSYDGQAVVVYRSVRSARDAEEWLSENGDAEVVLALCLEEEVPQSELTQVADLLEAQQCLDLSERLALRPIRDIILVADIQKQGSYAMLNIGGWVICMGTGTVDFAMLPQADLYFGGGAEPKNLNAKAVLLLREAAEEDSDINADVFVSTGEPVVSVRMGRSVMLKGVKHP